MTLASGQPSPLPLRCASLAGASSTARPPFVRGPHRSPALSKKRRGPRPRRPRPRRPRPRPRRRPRPTCRAPEGRPPGQGPFFFSGYILTSGFGKLAHAPHDSCSLGVVGAPTVGRPETSGTLGPFTCLAARWSLVTPSPRERAIISPADPRSGCASGRSRAPSGQECGMPFGSLGDFGCRGTDTTLGSSSVARLPN